MCERIMLFSAQLSRYHLQTGQPQDDVTDVKGKLYDPSPTVKLISN